MHSPHSILYKYAIFNDSTRDLIHIPKTTHNVCKQIDIHFHISKCVGSQVAYRPRDLHIFTASRLCALRSIREETATTFSINHVYIYIYREIEMWAKHNTDLCRKHSHIKKYETCSNKEYMSFSSTIFCSTRSHINYHR